MALSGTKTFSLDHLDIIEEACRIARITDFDSVPDANMKTVATKFLNAMASRWANKGVFLWRVTGVSITLVAGQQAYNTQIDRQYYGPATYGHYYRNSDSVDTELEFISKSEWQKLPDKATATGQVEKMLFDRVVTPSAYHYIYVYPIPTSSTLGTLHVQLVSKVDDFTNESDDIAFETNWYMALVYGLAVHMARISGAELDDIADLKADAARYFDEALHGKVHREQGDVRFIPGFYQRGRDYYI